MSHDQLISVGQFNIFCPFVLDCIAFIKARSMSHCNSSSRVRGDTCQLTREQKKTYRSTSFRKRDSYFRNLVTADKNNAWVLFKTVAFISRATYKPTFYILILENTFSVHYFHLGTWQHILTLPDRNMWDVFVFWSSWLWCPRCLSLFKATPFRDSVWLFPSWSLSTVVDLF